MNMEFIINRDQTIERSQLVDYPLWVMKDGIRLFEKNDLSQKYKDTYEEMYEGGRVDILIQIANENGGITILPETHLNLLDASSKQRVRPITRPTISRVICLAMRKVNAPLTLRG